MLEIFWKYYIYIVITIGILLLLLLFYIYILVLDRKLTKLENKIKDDFKKRLDFIPILYDMTSWRIKMHKKMFEKILEHRNLWIFNYNEMNFEHIVTNEVAVHKELIFLFKVISKLDSLKDKQDYIYVENFFNDNSEKIAINIHLYKIYAKYLNKLIKIKNYTILWLLIPIEKRVIT